MADALQRVIDEVVAPLATRVDGEGRFPREAVVAIGEAGLLGLTLSPAGLREAAAVIRRLAEACGSTAIVVMMHYVGSASIGRLGPPDVCGEIEAGRHLTTL